MKEKITVARRHFDLSRNFSHLVKVALEQSVISGNPDFYIGKPEKEPSKTYERVTKWSDFQIFVPLLFNFFHSIELKLKGFCYLKKLPAPNKIGHNLSDWLDTFGEYFPEDLGLMEVFDKYIFPLGKLNVLDEFYLDNELKNSDQFYVILKYPYKKDLANGFNYQALQGNREKGVLLFREIISDIDRIEELSLLLFEANVEVG